MCKRMHWYSREVAAATDGDTEAWDEEMDGEPMDEFGEPLNGEPMDEEYVEDSLAKDIEAMLDSESADPMPPARAFQAEARPTVQLLPTQEPDPLPQQDPVCPGAPAEPPTPPPQKPRPSSATKPLATVGLGPTMSPGSTASNQPLVRPSSRPGLPHLFETPKRTVATVPSPAPSTAPSMELIGATPSPKSNVQLTPSIPTSWPQGLTGRADVVTPQPEVVRNLAIELKQSQDAKNQVATDLELKEVDPEEARREAHRRYMKFYRSVRAEQCPREVVDKYAAAKGRVCLGPVNPPCHLFGSSGRQV